MSFWLPGQMGTFSAVLGEPGVSVPVVYYHTSADAGGGKSFSLGGRITAGIDVTGDLVFLFPTYVLGSPVAGGQASVALGMGGAT